MKTGLELIIDERLRQIHVEGWTAEHDDTEHSDGGLIDAAVCYAEAACPLMCHGDTPDNWPWDYQSWKPSKDPIRNLVKAGALIAAEIDRLQRANKKEEK